MTREDAGILLLGMKRLRCVQCGMEASPSSSWLWFGKEVELPLGTPGAPGRKLLWLCPDCAADLGSDEDCDAFFARLVAGELDK